MNRRNALIARLNPREAITGVNQKFETKERLAAAGVPVPPTLALIGDEGALANCDFTSLPDAFAVKPDRGRRGEGVILVDGRVDGGWRQLNGEVLTPAMLTRHVRRIMAGELSLEGSNADAALFEPLIRTHPDFARLVPYGLPDIRIICFGDIPLMAMTRLPTVESRGRANLHQGAVGAAIDFAGGSIFRAVLGQDEIAVHPSTGASLIGEAIPFWHEAVAAARRCSAALGLGYVGVDLVIDEARGVQVLECNAYPGLEIQNVNAAGLAGRVAQAERALRDRRSPRQFSAQGRKSDNRLRNVRTLAAVNKFVRTQAGQFGRLWNPPIGAGMGRAVALLLVAAALLIPEAPTHAQVGPRVVEQVDWVEKWDSASQRWVRVDDRSVSVPSAAVLATKHSRFGSTGIVVTETIIERKGRFIAQTPHTAAEQAGIARFGPFRVIDNKRAALDASTDAASPQAFAAMLASFPDLEELEFADAPGTSDDLANLTLGRAIRAAGLTTRVPPGRSVRSGAVELFLAGTRRTLDPGAMLAVHSWRDQLGREPADFAQDAPENRLYLDYYEEMGMTADQARAFYAMTNSVPHADALWLRTQDLARWITIQTSDYRVKP